jgi:hypothetical protein
VPLQRDLVDDENEQGMYLSGTWRAWQVLTIPSFVILQHSFVFQLAISLYIRWDNLEEWQTKRTGSHGKPSFPIQQAQQCK